jgi:hypothetical protein
MYKSPNMTPDVKRRVAVEMRIVKSAVKELLSHDFLLSVFDGEEETAHTSTDYKMLHDALMETDEDYLHVWKDGKRFGWVRFVYGNDGYDMIFDYSVNLDTFIAETNKLADSLE